MKINAFFNMNKLNQPSEGTQKNQTALPAGKIAGMASKESVDASKESIKNSEAQSSSILEKAYELYKNNGIDPNAKIMAETKKFLDKVSGNDKDKLFTIEMTASKGIDPTEKNLTAIHSALNDEAVSTETIETLMPETKMVQDVVKAIRKVEGHLRGTQSVSRKELQSTFESMGLSKEEAIAASDVVEKGLAQNQSTSEILNHLSKQFPKEPLKGMLEIASKLSDGFRELKVVIKDLLPHAKEVSLSFAAETDEMLLFEREAVNENSSLYHDKRSNKPSKNENDFSEGSIIANSKDSVKVTSSEYSVVEAVNDDNEDVDETDLESIDDFMSEGIDPFLESLEAMVAQVLHQTIANYGAHDLENYFSTENTKAYLVKEVTLKMIEVKQTFDQFQSSALKGIETVLSKNETMKINGEELSQLVAGTAQKLDHMIMKTDLTLYTDMKSEKKLVGLSSDLQQIQTLALKDTGKALHLLKEVHKKIEALVFQPSKEKVNVYMTQKAEEVIGHNTVTTAIERTKATGGAKMLMELIRHMGINHEPELLEKMLSSSKHDAALSNEKENLKSMLLKLESEAESDPKTVKSLEKALSNLTGQQLLNKQEPGKDTQMLFFSMPMGDTGQEVKLYIKSRNKLGGLDWENCTAFVMIDSDRFGPTGIRLSIADRYLNMSVISESDTLETVMKPLTQQLLVDLKDIGYLPNEVKFLKTSPQEEGPKVLKSSTEQPLVLDKSLEEAELRGKGFELKI